MTRTSEHGKCAGGVENRPRLMKMRNLVLAHKTSSMSASISEPELLEIGENIQKHETKVRQRSLSLAA